MHAKSFNATVHAIPHSTNARINIAAVTEHAMLKIQSQATTIHSFKLNTLNELSTKNNQRET